jgi:hypothetical protein
MGRFAWLARVRIERSLRAMWSNDDHSQNLLAKNLLEGRYLWLEQGAIPLPFDEEQLVPPSMEEILRTPSHRPSESQLHTH